MSQCRDRQPLMCEEFLLPVPSLQLVRLLHQLVTPSDMSTRMLRLTVTLSVSANDVKELVEAFRFLVNDKRFWGLPMCLETPKGPDLAEDRENLTLLRSLID